MPMPSRLLQRGITLWKSGEKDEARNIFKAVIHAEKDYEQGWYWYIQTLETRPEKISALESYLNISPGDEKARTALQNLRAQERGKNVALPASRVEAAASQRENSAGGTQSQPAAPSPASRPSGPQKKRGTAILKWGLLALVLGVLVYGWAAASANYFQAKSDYESEKQAHLQLLADAGRLNTAYQTLSGDYGALVARFNDLYVQHDATVTQLNDLTGKYQEVETRLKNLNIEYQAVLTRYNDLNQEHMVMINKYNALAKKYGVLTDEYNNLNDIAVKPPYIVVNGRNVIITFYDQNGEIIKWTTPFEGLENAVERGYQDRKRLENDPSLWSLEFEYTNGDTFHVTDYRHFVDASAFVNVIPDMYNNRTSDEDFIRSVWEIVRQLTVYSGEIKDTPRFPMETLLSGGGDCEDTSILFASMIKAAPADWTVELVYLDGDHPTDPVDMNHMAVAVETGSKRYLIETTSKTNMTPYDDINGWYLEIQ